MRLEWSSMKFVALHSLEPVLTDHSRRSSHTNGHSLIFTPTLYPGWSSRGSDPHD